MAEPPSVVGSCQVTDADVVVLAVKDADTAVGATGAVALPVQV